MQGCLSHINVIHQGSNSPLAHHEQFHSLGVRIRTLSARIHETLIWVGANLHLQHLVRDRCWLFRRLLWRWRRDKLLGCWYSQRKLQSCTNEDVPFVRCRLKHLPSRRALTGFCACTRAKAIEKPNFRCIISTFIHVLRSLPVTVISLNNRGNDRKQLKCPLTLIVILKLTSDTWNNW